MPVIVFVEIAFHPRCIPALCPQDTLQMHCNPDQVKVLTGMNELMNYPFQS